MSKKKIVAIHTKIQTTETFDAVELLKKLREFDFKFNGSRDNEVNNAESISYFGEGPYFYVFLSQEEGRQWSIYPGNPVSGKDDGYDISSQIYDARITTVEELKKDDVEFLQN